MLDSPKWQTMWMESQHCSESVDKIRLSSQQSKKILEDLRTSCTSSNKAVQLEALKCWGIYIKNQNMEDWKINAVCYTAVKPLLTKKLQPLHKDLDVCKLKLNLLWNLVVKVQNIMHLEGPQYILEVFLQSCVTWLSVSDGVDNEISVLILKLILALFELDEGIIDCDKEMFPSLSVKIFDSKKLFHSFVDELLSVFISWKKVKDKKIMLKIWKCLLELCEHNCEIIPTPIWHKIFKIVGQICSEESENLKDRLSFLHGCATTLRSVLRSSKFIDFGNLLTTPCEALLKKLMELCTFECQESIDYDLFLLSQEMTQVLSDESIAFSGYDLCIFALDFLEEFALKTLYWGVWCGLVACYKMRLLHIDKSQFSKVEMKFYRKLRSISVNFELDKNYLHKDCLNEVEKNIKLLNINCLCTLCEKTSNKQKNKETAFLKDREVDSQYKNETKNETSGKVVALTTNCYPGKFSPFSAFVNYPQPIKTVSVKFDLVKELLKTVDVKPLNPIFNILPDVGFIITRRLQINESCTNNSLIKIDVLLNKEFSESKSKSKVVPAICYPSTKNKKLTVFNKEIRCKKPEVEEDAISTPRTRSRKKMEEEMKKKFEESVKRRKRKSFENVVQEIVEKNKLRKTEKRVRKKSPVSNKKVQLNRKKLMEKIEEEKENEVDNKRQLRKSKKENPKNSAVKNEKLNKNEGKLENYFEVISKKLGNYKKEQNSKVLKNKKKKEKNVRDNKCCEAGKDLREQKETNWKQTSLKTIVHKKNGSEKVRQSMRIRNQTVSPAKESPKAKKGKKILNAKTVVDLSPFKEVLHDHEYAKMPLDLNTSQHLRIGNTKDTIENVVKKIVPELKNENQITKLENKTPEADAENKLKTNKNGVAMKEIKKIKIEREETENEEKGEDLLQKPKVKILHEKRKPEKDIVLVKSKFTETEVEKGKNLPEKPEVKVVMEDKKCENVVLPFKSEVLETDSEKATQPPNDLKKMESLVDPENNKTATTTEAINTQEGLNNELQKSSTPEKECTQSSVLKILWTNCRNDLSEEDKEVVEDVEDQSLEPKNGKRKLRMMDSLHPSKKIKLSTEEETTEKKLDVVEKENIEVPAEERIPEMVSPTKEILVLKAKTEEGSKSPNGNTCSRALRMIALIPESTKPEQVHRESTNKQEISKCKKTPNVDNYSRASKMLALLSGNVVKNVENCAEVEDSGTKIEEESGNGKTQLVTTLKFKTFVSTLKSSGSIKKRRSIRFDDTKNETILYQTDTPPCQVLEKKEKCRRIKPEEF